jgi:uncharacterized membrane protein
LLAGIFFTRTTAPAEQTSTVAMQQPANTAGDADDEQVMATVAQLSPDVRETYRQGLHDVNTYIQDAERSVKENPDDQSARQLLMQAYQQKAMLYQMATRSSE